MSENLATQDTAPKVDVESMQPVFQPTPLRAPLTELDPLRTRGATILPGCLLVLAMIAVGSALIFSVILYEPESRASAIALASATPLPTIQASSTPQQPTATRMHPVASASIVIATTATSEPATAEPTSTEAATQAHTATIAATTARSTSASPDAAHDLLNRINNFRAQNGLSPLKLNDTLAAAALRHSQDMSNSGRIDHTGSDGSNARQRISDAGYSGKSTGEIIFGGQVTLNDAWDFWSTDQFHVPALLNKNYTEMGLGIVKTDNRTYYTVDFGG